MPCDPWKEPLALPDRLRVVRARHGLSAGAAAERCGLKKATWEKWERGSKPREYMQAMYQISVGLEVDLEWLVADPISDMWPYTQLALYLDDGPADGAGEPWKIFPSSTRTATLNGHADSRSRRSVATGSSTPRSPDGSRAAA